MYKKTVFYFLLSLGFTNLLSAQDKGLLVKGDKSYDNKDYKNALQYYQQGLKGFPAIKPKFSYVYLRMGNSQKELKKYEDAIKSYDKAMKFEEKNFLPDEWTELHKNASWCEREIFNAPAREELKKNPVNVAIKNMGKNVNSTFDEYCPSATADESYLIFTSRREGSTGEKKDLDGGFFEDFYYCTRSKGNWAKARNLGAPINTENHESIPCISADGQSVFYYKWMNDEGNGDLYSSKLKGKKWREPVKLSAEINTENWESQPSVSADGNMLFFVSNRPEGYGGWDIYVSVKDKSSGQWQTAENLGSVINTKFDEASPFIHPDGKTLYFSSQGHPGMGEHDVFISQLGDDGTWSKPGNIGYPVNSEGDDVFFRFSASGDKAYFSSVRKEGLGGQDLYVMEFPKTEEGPQLERPKGVTTLLGYITDEKTHVPLEAEIRLDNLDKGEMIATFTSNADSGKYLVMLPSGGNYGISVTREGYLFHSENFNIPKEKEFQVIRKDVELKKIEKGKTVILKNIFFDYDKTTLRSESRLELNRLVQLMKENPKLVIEIGGHTDNMGSDDYNMQLSLGRAKTVVDYLADAGISRNRMVPNGYGETQPIASNQNPDGTDSPEGRQLNRRTEFKILEQ